VRFYNKRGTEEQWIKGKQAAHWTRLSCHRFRANEVRLQLGVLAYKPGNLRRRLVPAGANRGLVAHRPSAADRQDGWTAVNHAPYDWLMWAESHLTRRLFEAMLQRMWALPVPTG
jgi:hypothetical protein